MVQGRFWQRPASWFNSTPRFLAAQRSAVSSRREEIAQRKPLKGFPLDSFGNKRAAALLRSRESQIYSAHPVERLLRILEALSFWHASTHWFVKSLTIFLPSSKFGGTCPPQGIFALQKSLRGDCGGDGVPSAVGNAPPAQRNFQRKFALRQVGSSKFVVPPTSSRSKVRNNARLGKSLYRAAPGCQRDRGPSVSGGVQRNPFQGVPLGNFFAEARHRASFRR